MSGRLVLVTGLAIGVYGMEATLLGTLLPELSATLTPAQSGTVASVQSIGLIVASFVTGPLIDRAGARAGMVAGLAFIALALSFLPSAHGYAALLFAMTLLGVGGGVISTSTNTMASQIGGTNKAGMLNRLNVFFGLGGLATPALGALLSSAELCGVIVLLAGATLVLLWLTAAPHTPVARVSDGDAGTGLFLRPVFLMLCLFLFLYVAAEVGVWNWLAAYLTGKGMPKNQALHVLSFGFATGIITGRLAAAKILTRFRPANVTFACSMLMAVATSAMLLAPGTVATVAAVFGAGLAMAPVYPTTLGLVAEAFPKGTATAIGLAVTMGWIGVAVSSKIIGEIAGAHPDRLGHALLVIPAASMLMILVNVVFRRMVFKQSTGSITNSRS